MAEREGTPEDFAQMAARLRGQDMPTKEEINPPEPESEPDPENEELVARLLSPKAGHLELIRRLHGTEGP
jgi:hypothetical protein